jgi:hypothetical protein
MTSRVKINRVGDQNIVTNCALCESEAEFSVGGMALCKTCSGKRESEFERLGTNRQVRARLQREILASTVRANAASQDLSAIMRDIPSGLPQPDGSQRIQNAAHVLAAARNEVMQAHSRLDEFLARGGVSGDWKPDGTP